MPDPHASKLWNNKLLKLIWTYKKSKQPVRSRLDLDFQERLENKSKYHRCNKKVDNPPVSAAAYRRPIGIVDAYGFHDTITGKRLFPRENQDIRPVPTWPHRAGPHETVTDGEFFVDLLLIHSKDKLMIALFTSFDIPRDFPLCEDADGTCCYLDCWCWFKRHIGPIVACSIGIIGCLFLPIALWKTSLFIFKNTMNCGFRFFNSVLVIN